MAKRKYIFLLLFIVLFSSFACSKDKPETEKPEIPLEPPKPPEDKSDKSIQLWVDAHANFSRFALKSNITNYLEKMKNTGFNEIYLDVKPGIGYALYKSDILPYLTQWGNEIVERDWDYLQFWIDEAERFDIKVIASISTTGFGYTKTKTGFVFDDHKWDDKTQMLWNGGVLKDIRNLQDVDAAMLDPAFPEVQELIISICEEIVGKYPKLKGLCLDYCRYYNGEGYGFGDFTIAEFEKYSGKKVNSREDILTATGAPGALFSQWIEFRSVVITNLITNIRAKIKSVNPKTEFHFWASAHWDSRYSVGQNWASKKYIPSGWVYTNSYYKTGFADLLDVFSLGAYAEAVWKSEAPGSAWSVENFVTTYSRYIMDECKVIGCLGTYSYASRANSISDAVYLCLKNTAGVAVFELSHVINNNQWAAIKDGIERGLK